MIGGSYRRRRTRILILRNVHRNTFHHRFQMLTKLQIHYDNPTSDRLQDCVEKWQALVKDGEDPISVYPFSQMSPAAFNFIKITYEASLLVEPSVAAASSINLTPKKKCELKSDDKSSPLALRPSPKGKDEEMKADEEDGKSSWDGVRFTYQPSQ